MGGEWAFGQGEECPLMAEQGKHGPAWSSQERWACEVPGQPAGLPFTEAEQSRRCWVFISNCQAMTGMGPSFFHIQDVLGPAELTQ